MLSERDFPILTKLACRSFRVVVPLALGTNIIVATSSIMCRSFNLHVVLHALNF